ncbi:Uncharacterized protein TCM_001839 [Theobroma cacao]|uniref:Uncharacterized protein n=1 Tax=Theobroma cacao TaxID=3641 RepID=A0A061DLL7_THECC|nr:Uncharacterized protein TCM_001839 [Theobroma cacao]
MDKQEKMEEGQAITQKPIKSWYEICTQEEQESQKEVGTSSNPLQIFQDSQYPYELNTQIKQWIESLSQSPEVALALASQKDQTPLKQIAVSALESSKKKEIVLHRPKTLQTIFPESQTLGQTQS